MELNPSVISFFLEWNFSPLATGVGVLLAGFYIYLYRKIGPFGWGRAVAFFAGLLLMLFALQSSLVSFVANSMALYTLRLMILAELVPILLLAGLPAGVFSLRGLPQFWHGLFEPWVGLVFYNAVVIFWNLPQPLSASLVNATYHEVLPWLYVLGGTWFWLPIFQTLRDGPGFSQVSRVLYAGIGNLPMMVIGLVWLNSQEVIYSPYVNVPCLWNTTPTDNQQAAGVVMTIFSTPAMVVAVFELFRWLLSDNSHPEQG